MSGILMAQSKNHVKRYFRAAETGFSNVALLSGTGSTGPTIDIVDVQILSVWVVFVGAGTVTMRVNVMDEDGITAIGQNAQGGIGSLGYMVVGPVVGYNSGQLGGLTNLVQIRVESVGGDKTGIFVRAVGD